MRQATYNAYASVAGRVSIAAEKLYLQGAISTFKFTYNAGFEQNIQGASRGATNSAITFAGQFGLSQLDILRIQTESERRRESERNRGQSCKDTEADALNSRTSFMNDPSLPYVAQVPWYIRVSWIVSFCNIGHYSMARSHTSCL